MLLHSVTLQGPVILSEATRSLIARGAVERPATPPAAATLSMVSTHKPAHGLQAWYADAL